MTFPVSKEARQSAERLLKDESLTLKERVLVEGLMDGTWRLTPDGFLISSGSEPTSSPPDSDDAPGPEDQKRHRAWLSEQFPEATEEGLDRLMES